MQMMDKMRGPAQRDKRQDERFSSHAPVIFSRFGIKYHREYAAMTFNHSRNGMCLESAEALKPGTVLYIRRADQPENEYYQANWKHLRIFSLAEVKWCREIRDKFGAYCCVGVRYI